MTDQLVVTTQPPTHVTAGNAFDVQFSVKDGQGNLMTGFSGALTIAVENPGANPGGGTLGGTLTVTVQNGVADFNNLTLDKPGTGYILMASGDGVASATTQPFTVDQDIVVESVNTTDSREVDVKYDINTDLQSKGVQSFEIDIYRSDKPMYDATDANNVEVASYQLTGNQLNQGSGQTITIDSSNGTWGMNANSLVAPLAPDPQLPYVLAVADPGNQLPAEVTKDESQAHFQIFIIGAISPGFNGPSPSDDQSWMRTMQIALHQAYGTDGITFPFFWHDTLPVPGRAVAAGNALYQDIVEAANGSNLDGQKGSIPNLQENDIIDVQLIGHSRGASVIGQAMQNLITNNASLPAQLQHGYYKMTFLDPHPANLTTAGEVSVSTGSSLADLILSGAILDVQIGYALFSTTYNDPSVTVDPRVNQVEEYYQNNLTSSISTAALLNYNNSIEQYFNLLGVPSQVTIVDDTKTHTDVIPLSGLGFGHSDVHDWYTQKVISTLANGGPPPNPNSPGGPSDSPPTLNIGQFLEQILYPQDVEDQSEADTLVGDLSMASTDLDQGNYSQAISDLETFDNAVQSAPTTDFGPGDATALVSVGQSLISDLGSTDVTNFNTVNVQDANATANAAADDPANNQQISGSITTGGSFNGTAQFSVGNYTHNPNTNPADQVSQATFDVQTMGLDPSADASASVTFTGQVPTQQLQQATLYYFGNDGQWHTAAFYNGSAWVEVGPSGDMPIQEQNTPVSGSGMSTISLPEDFSNDTTPAISGLNGTVFTITVPAPISLTSLPGGTVDQAYNQTIVAGGGTGDITLTVSNINGSIPGLPIPDGDTNTLNISGIPTEAGTVSFTVQATDSVGIQFSQNYTLTVTTADPTESTISLLSSNIAAGATTTITLTALDITGVQETAGGLVVAFGLGSGSANGTFSAITDNGNGTYLVEFTGSIGGTNTITATINGQAVTTTLPSVTVTPGPVSLAQSTLSTSAGALPTGGVTTVTLTAEDAFGNQEAGGGLTIAFSLASGAGNFSEVTDNGDGTFAATFTATSPGRDTVVATVNNQSVTSSAVGITVVGLSLSESSFSATPMTIASGGTATLTLTPRDVSGNQETTGGLNVAFALGTGTGGGSVGAVMDNGDGTYTATFTATIPGSNMITATIDGQQVTSTVSITIVPVLNPASHLVVTPDSTSLTAGTSFNVTVSALDANNNDAAGFTDTVTFNSSDATATFVDAATGAPLTNQAYTFTHGDAGVHTFTVTLTQAGIQTLTATDTVTGNTVTQGTSSVSVAPAAAAQLAFIGTPTGLPGLSLNSVQVDIQDAYGNLVTDDTSNITLAVSGPESAFDSGTPTLAASGGVANFTDLVLNTAGTNYTLTATATDNGATLTPATANLTVAQHLTSTTISGTASNPNPSSYGELLSFTATVTDTSNANFTPTGTVTFYTTVNGVTTTLPTAKLKNGVATLYTLSLGEGGNSITATYNGTISFVGSTTATGVSQTVNTANTDLALSVAGPNPSTYGEPLTFTATLTDTSDPTVLPIGGKVTLFNGTTKMGIGIVVNGTTTIVVSTLAASSTPYAITASYSGPTNAANGMANYASSSTPSILSQTVNTASTSTTITAAAANPNPSTYGEALSFTATVTDTSDTSVIPTRGTVTFYYNGSTSLGSANLVNGTATFTTSALPTGTWTITATYNGTPTTGTANFASSTTATGVSQTVNTASTSTTISAGAASPNPSSYGQQLTFTAAVTDTSDASVIPTGGTVSFYNGSTKLGSVNLVKGAATLKIATLATGVYTITATYNGTPTTGTANFGSSTTVTGVSQTVNTASTSTTISAASGSPNPSSYGESLTFTATVTDTSDSSVTPTGGTVTFFNGTTNLGAANLVKGTATFSTSALPAGTWSITATYNGTPASGTANFGSSTTATGVSHTVNTANTNTAISAAGGSPNPSSYGESLTFTATVTDTSDSSVTPTGGTVTFFNGTTNLGSANLVKGTASFSTAAIPAGDNWTITATYNGSPPSGTANFGSSTTATGVAQTVTTASTSATVSAAPGNPVSPSYGEVLTFTAMVIDTSDSKVIPTGGKVTFYQGTIRLGAAVLYQGKATLPTSGVLAGTNSITVIYEGTTTSTNFAASPTSPAITQTVNTANTSVSISAAASNPNPSTYGQPLTFTATVTDTSDTKVVPIGGKVTLYNGTTSVGAGYVVNGTATITLTTLAVSATPYSLTAIYGGTTNVNGVANFAASPASQALSQTVDTAASTSTAVTTSPDTAAGQLVTFTATITNTASGSVVNPTGTVTFKDVYNGTTTVLGTKSVSNGVATFTTKRLASGTHDIFAFFANGANNFLASSSDAIQIIL